ncbi:hydrogenase assembly protein HupF [Ignicoccus islandicus DSM 13165]|uniref:Hydrogenase assembly protein HupF n=1 Tax=Ignicoccus islandicus DSM 13165 TaxID=940295 RepID=A0A0U3F7H8_9CREN|nr:hydrogenase expression/formation protein HypE [Ignicoccus islandicus]ALU11593.1 hydrogenase assembly protein HupF [Ignicoccus islandicus DSM 13165]
MPRTKRLLKLNLISNGLKSTEVDSLSVTLAIGSGGKDTEDFVKRFILPLFKLRSLGGVGLEDMEDGATIPIGDGKHLVISIDSYTVNPPFFPGGNIGKLAASGSLNDVAVMGAEPKALMDAIIVEEGFPLRDLKTILNSMAEVANSMDVALLGGDTKVMPKGSIDKIVIATVGIGIAEEPLLTLDRARPGDKIIVTGPVGDHGATILALQFNLKVETLKSDVRPIWSAVRALRKFGDNLRSAKDPTRGGLAMALNEIAERSGNSIVVYEDAIPMKNEVRTYAEMLGVEPLALASEGQAIFVVDPSIEEEALEALRKEGYEEARTIGEVKGGKSGYVVLKTRVGGLRILEKPIGELVPRIC